MSRSSDCSGAEQEIARARGQGLGSCWRGVQCAEQKLLASTEQEIAPLRSAGLVGRGQCAEQKLLAHKEQEITC